MGPVGWVCRSSPVWTDFSQLCLNTVNVFRIKQTEWQKHQFIEKEVPRRLCVRFREVFTHVYDTVKLESTVSTRLLLNHAARETVAQEHTTYAQQILAQEFAHVGNSPRRIPPGRDPGWIPGQIVGGSQRRVHTFSVCVAW